MSRLAEFDFIARLLEPLADKHAALRLGDDAALIDGPGDGTGQTQWVIAKDAIVENVHFREQDPPTTIAMKLLGTNLSDLAAMGAEPAFYLTTIARPSHMDDAWLQAFCEGLERMQKHHKLALIGGDTVSTSGPITLTCTIIGQVPKGQALLRSTAKAGDLIFVSGTLGDSALGLRILNGLGASDEARIYLGNRYQMPEPRLHLGIALRGLASACIDISDGLLADIGHIAERSGLGATIRLDQLPLSELGRQLPDAVQAALSGGDDYELAFCAAPADKLKVIEAAHKVGVIVSEIGVMEQGSVVRILDENGQAHAAAQTGWQHV